MEPITPIAAEQVRLLGDQLLIDGLTVDDEATIALAREREAAGESLDALVSQAIEIGARILQREQTASDTDFVKAEFERQANEVEQQFSESAKKVRRRRRSSAEAARSTLRRELQQRRSEPSQSTGRGDAADSPRGVNKAIHRR